MASHGAATKIFRAGGFEKHVKPSRVTVLGRAGCILAKGWGVNSCSESL